MRILRGAIGLATVLTAWQLLAMTGLINAVLMPSPARLVDTIVELLRDGSLLIHLTASLERVSAGFVLAALCGLALGVLTGWWRPASDFLKRSCHEVALERTRLHSRFTVPCRIITYSLCSGPHEQD
jgi:ABC-type nitrate/sulfonate/bicarbonate transport system permease component